MKRVLFKIHLERMLYKTPPSKDTTLQFQLSTKDKVIIQRNKQIVAADSSNIQLHLQRPISLFFIYRDKYEFYCPFTLTFITVKDGQFEKRILPIRKTSIIEHYQKQKNSNIKKSIGQNYVIESGTLIYAIEVVKIESLDEQLKQSKVYAQQFEKSSSILVKSQQIQKNFDKSQSKIYRSHRQYKRQHLLVAQSRQRQQNQSNFISQIKFQPSRLIDGRFIDSKMSLETNAENTKQYNMLQEESYLFPQEIEEAKKLINLDHGQNYYNLTSSIEKKDSKINIRLILILIVSGLILLLHDFFLDEKKFSKFHSEKIKISKPKRKSKN